jgi:hypothetical protein
MPNLCFPTGGSTDHVVHSGVSRARNVIALFFMLRSGWYGFDKKRSRTPYAELVFLHQLGCAGRVVYSGASGAQNVNALFFMLEWAWEGFH